MLTSNSEALTPYLDKYKALLRRAGTELFSNYKITDETMMALNNPIIPNDIYRTTANENWG